MTTIKTRTKKPKTEFENKLKWIRKNKTSRYVLEVELDYLENDLRKILSTSDELRIIRNTIVGEIFFIINNKKRTFCFNFEASLLILRLHNF